MFGSEKRILAKLFRARNAATHRQALEDSLLAGFDRRQPTESRPPVTRFPRRILLVSAVAALALGSAAFAAPVNVDLVVGRAIDIVLPPGAQLPDPGSLAMLFGDGGAGKHAQRAISARIEKENDTTTLHLDVWGTDLPAGPLAPKIREQNPSLANATIDEKPLSGDARLSLGGLLAHRLFDTRLDQMTVDEVKKHVMEQLAHEGVTPDDVQVEKIEGGDGHSGMKVRVEKREMAIDDRDGDPNADVHAKLHEGGTLSVRVPFEVGGIEVSDPSIVEATRTSSGVTLKAKMGSKGSATVTIRSAADGKRTIVLPVDVGALQESGE